MKQFFRRLVYSLFDVKVSRPCPVCNGKGYLNSWFSREGRLLSYQEFIQGMALDQCQVCHGEGVVWERAR